MQIRNGAELLKAVPAIALTSVTAGGSGDDTKILGEVIDRLGFQSGLLDISFNAKIADTKTLSVEVEITESDDNVTYTTPVVIKAEAIVYTATASVTNKRLELALPVGLAQCKRYIKFNVTPDLSNTATDTLSIVGSFILTDPTVEPLELEFTAI